MHWCTVLQEAMQLARQRWMTIITMTLAAVALVLAVAMFVSGRQMAGRVDERMEQLSDRELTLEPAVKDAVRISRQAHDVPAPVGGRGPMDLELNLEAKELVGQLADGVTTEFWTFDSTVPGPLLRVRVGDTIRFTLSNAKDSKQAHNIDLHAVNGPGGGAEATFVMPGESKSFRFQALNPGLFVYHCAAPHIPTHIAMGMYGLILVEPEGGLPPVDKEFYVMQGEVYANAPPGRKGHVMFSSEGMFSEMPHYVVFNGQFQALTGDYAMKAEVGDRVRIFVGNGGPNLVSSFHVIGEILDVVHAEGASEAVTNLQTTLVPAGGAAWVEFDVTVPGEYLLVDHSISRAVDKGALATLVVEGPQNPDVFEALDVQSGDDEDSGYEMDVPGGGDAANGG